MEDARAYATWAAMEREFALGGAASGARLLLPRHSRSRFIELLEWMAQDDDLTRGVRCCRRCCERRASTRSGRSWRTGALTRACGRASTSFGEGQPAWAEALSGRGGLFGRAPGAGLRTPVCRTCSNYLLE